MGVSGSGKTTIGELLAERLRVDYGEADDFHPEANKQKMSAGIALDDDDRRPWLLAIGDWLAERENRGAVATCSALKEAYRDPLRQRAPRTVFLHLTTSREVLAERMGRRQGHFMPVSLLDSQLDTLEDLGPEEPGLAVEATEPPATIVDRFLTWWKERS
jgi:gluconokinase